MEHQTACDIVIPIWNQLDLTQRCLESIVRTTPEPVRLILVDNGSAAPTQQFLEQFKSQAQLPTQLIRHESNLGFIKAVNRGIQASQAQWICLLNNDTVVTPGWLSEMIQVAQNDPTIGLVNPTSNSLGFHTGKTPLEQVAKNLKDRSGQCKELVTALGFCLLAQRSLFEKIGLLDESFGMGNFDDDDLSRRAKQVGLRCVMACGSYVFHEEKASFRSLPDWEREFDRNRQIYEKRWGRPIRIFWVNANSSTGESVTTQTALQLTHEGHWICFVDPTHQLPQTLLTSAQISEFKSKLHHWRLRTLVRLLTKRKKPFDLVISDDPVWSRWVKRLGWLHHAHALDQPSSKEIVERCQTLSRSPLLS